MFTLTHAFTDGYPSRYATESAYTTTAKVEYVRPNLRQMLLDGNFFVASVMASTLTKLALKYVISPMECAFVASHTHTRIHT